jgi:beta-galactosidase
MLDGDPTTGWSNFYNKSATANLHAVSVSRAADWVSVSWPKPQSFSSVTATFVTGGSLALPSKITVSYWDGREYVAVKNLSVTLATASGQPSTLTFDAVRASRVRVDMTSPTPGTGAGFLRIAELQVLSGGTNIA